MGFFKRLTQLFSFPSGTDDRAYWISAKCNRCGEIIQARIDIINDLSVDYGESDQETSYICRKTLMGEGRCFQRVEVTLKFDANRRLVDREITGGQFVDEENESA